MDDWSVDDEIYEYYEKVWEIYTVNRFATKYKKNCVSIIKNIGVLILNAQMLLMQAGRRSIIGWFLPQNLMSKVIRSYVSFKYFPYSQ